MHRERLSDQKIEFFNEEARNSLDRAGYHELKPLLSEEIQTKFLEGVRDFAFKWVHERKWGRAKSCIVNETIAGIPAHLRIIPPNWLNAICGPISSDDTLIRPTTIGKVVSLIYERSDQGMFLLAIDGLAAEQTGDKGDKSRPPEPAAAFFSINVRESGVLYDADLVMLPSGWWGYSEAEIVNCLKGYVGQHLDVDLKELGSSKRPGFNSVQLGVLSTAVSFQRREWYSTCQIAYPEFAGKYDPRLSLLHFLLSRGDRPDLVLLLPTKEIEEGFIGVSIDLFNRTAYYNEVNFDFCGARRNLSPVVYFQDAFPANAPEEAFYHFLHDFRTWPWSDSFPLIRDLLDEDESLEQYLKNGDEYGIDRMSRLTAMWLYDEVILPIVKNPRLLGSFEQRSSFTAELISVLKSAIIGDPVVTLLRCRECGDNIAGPIYGMGLISEDGLLPNLAVFLKSDHRDLRLLKEMSECEPGTVQCWKRFLGFLYEETGYNHREVGRLLTPSFFKGFGSYDVPSSVSREVWQNLCMVEKKPEKRTYLWRYQRTIEKAVRSVMRQADFALTTDELVEGVRKRTRRAISTEKIEEVLKILRKFGQIEDLRNDSDLENVLPCENDHLWAERYSHLAVIDSGMMAPVSRVYWYAKHELFFSLTEIYEELAQDGGAVMDKETILEQIGLLEELRALRRVKDGHFAFNPGWKRYYNEYHVRSVLVRG